MISPPAGCREELQNSPDLRLTMTAATKLFVEYGIFLLWFLRRGEYIGERWAPGAWWGHHAIARRGPTLGCALLWRGALGAPPQVPSRLRKLPDVIFTEEKISPDFDDIFRVGFVETKNSRNTELALGHLVNRLVPEKCIKII